MLELRAIHLALRGLLPFISHKRHVLVTTDSTSTVYHINHQGGAKSLRCLQVARELLTWTDLSEGSPHSRCRKQGGQHSIKDGISPERATVTRRCSDPNLGLIQGSPGRSFCIHRNDPLPGPMACHWVGILLCVSF